MGTQEGRHIEIFNCFELVFKVVDASKGGIEFDPQLIKHRLEAYTKIFPSFEFLGWYSSSSKNEPTDADKIVHKKMQAYNENSLYLILNSSVSQKSAAGRKELPVFIYDTSILSSGIGFQYNLIQYKIETLESERISVDHIAKQTDSLQVNSRLSSNMQTTLNALKLLKSRLKALINIVNNSEEVKKNNDFMRRLNNICSQLPIVSKENFNKEMLSEYADTTFVTQLATITKGFDMLSDLVENYSQAFESKMGGHLGGGMMNFNEFF